MVDYPIFAYSKTNLLNVIHEANSFLTPKDVIENGDRHFGYLHGYLAHDKLSAKFILVEKDYVSVDYLSDYAFYYSRSYPEYKSKCVRLHFFSDCFNSSDDLQKEFSNCVLQSLPNNDFHLNRLSTSYLGFIVIRPIPVYYLGFSLLKTYNTFDEKSSRFYWGTKKYIVHLLSLEFEVESLAFISQDNNVAACATIAVWFMLQRAVENYYINLKSPFQITTDAGLILKDGNRSMPTSGLDPVAICSAITKSNLQPLIFENKQVSSNWFYRTLIRRAIGIVSEPKLDKELYFMNQLKEHINAYSSIKVPIIIGLQVPDGEFHNHAIAVVGHSVDDNDNFVYSNFDTTNDMMVNPFHHAAQRLNKLYCHDDQWGPFVSVKIDNTRGKLKTPWSHGIESEKLSAPKVLILSLFDKVRIPYTDIRQDTILLNKFIYYVLVENSIKIKPVWDIRLYFSHDFKKIVAERFGLISRNNSSGLFRLLSFPFPKYIWVSALMNGQTELGYFIFDATGLRGTSLLIGFFSFDYVFSLWLISKYKVDLKRLGSISKALVFLGFDQKIKLFLPSRKNYLK